LQLGDTGFPLTHPLLGIRQKAVSFLALALGNRKHYL
jgi:hypothetical protein